MCSLNKKLMFCIYLLVITNLKALEPPLVIERGNSNLQRFFIFIKS